MAILKPEKVTEYKHGNAEAKESYCIQHYTYMAMLKPGKLLNKVLYLHVNAEAR